MKNKGLLVVVSVMVVLGLLLGGFGCAAPSPAPTPKPTPTPTPVKPIELKFAYTWAETTGFSQTHAWMMEQLTKRTNGQVKVSFLPPGSMGGANEMLTVVKTGGADFTQLSPAYWPAEFPIYNALVMQIFQSHEEANWVANQMEAEIPETAAILQREHAGQNIKGLLETSAESEYSFTTRGPVTKLADLKGLKARSFGKWGPALYGKIDVVPVTVMLAEVYDALSKGVIDANVMSYIIQAQYKLNEVANHVSFGTGVSSAYGVIFMNLDSWNSLPENAKDILEDLRWDAMEYEQALVKEQEKQYGPLYIFDKVPQTEQDYIYSLWDEILDTQWMKEMTDAGKGGDAETFLRILREERVKFRK